MSPYLISFGAHAVAQEAINAGVYLLAGGLEGQRASAVATDGTVTDGPYPEALAGLTVVDLPSREEALKWAAKIAAPAGARKKSGNLCPTPNRPAA